MSPIAFFLVTLISLYKWVLIVWFLLGLLISFKIVNRYQPFVQKLEQVLFQLTEPVLKPIRRYLPPLGGVDISPVILIVLLETISYTLSRYF